MQTWGTLPVRIRIFYFAYMNRGKNSFSSLINRNKGELS